MKSRLQVCSRSC